MCICQRANQHFPLDLPIQKCLHRRARRTAGGFGPREFCHAPVAFSHGGSVEPYRGPTPRAEVRATSFAITQLMATVGAQAPETGGILLGPIGSTDITDFYFDQGAACTRSTYTPDYVTLRKKMRTEWLPSGIDMKGFGHSHPGQFDLLSHGDLIYIARLLERNPDMAWFVAPIVIPSDYRFRMWIVPRQCPETPVEARVVFI